MKRITATFFYLLLFIGSHPVNASDFCSSPTPQEGKAIEYYSNISHWNSMIYSNNHTTGTDGEISVGVVLCNNEPMLIPRWDGKYEGFYADYYYILSKTLNYNIKVRAFSNIQQAQIALKKGRIQLISNTSISKSKRNKNESLPFIVQPLEMIVSKKNLSRPFKNLKIVVMADEPKEVLDNLRGFFKSVDVAITPEHAIQDVREGNADGYIGPQVGIRYPLIFHPYIDIAYRRDAPHILIESDLFSNDERLISKINKIIIKIPSSVRSEIFNRWLLGVPHYYDKGEIKLSKNELEWIKKNPVIDVAVMSNAQPYSYLNIDKQITGMDVDFLNLIGDRVGLKFNFILENSPQEIVKSLKNGRAQITPSLVSTEQRQSWLTFSHPYGSLEWVMITRNSRDSPKNIQQLAGRRIAISQGHILRGLLKKYKAIIIDDKNARTDMDMLMSGDVDAVFDDFLSANYSQVTHYGDNISVRPLYITDRVFQIQDQFSTPHAYHEIISIINKTLDNISPEDVRLMHMKWASVDNLSETSHDPVPEWMIACGGGLFIIAVSSLFWGFWLVHQIRMRKVAEVNLQNSRSYWKILFKTIPTPIFVCDSDMNIAAGNPWFWRSMGDTPGKNLIGENFLSTEFFSSTDAHVIRVNFFNSLSGGQTYFSDHSIYIQGKKHEIYLWLEHYKNAGGDVQGVIGGWFDVTERKRLSMELRVERDKAEHASKEKSDFVARMSHEIRTALSIITGILELEVKEQHENVPLHIANNAATSLQGIIGDVLDFSRIESGAVTLNYKPHLLRDVLAQCVQPFIFIARNKGLFFEQKMILSDKHYLLDVTRLTQITNNLLSNAIKFTSKGGITFRANVEENVKNSLSILNLQIIDTGCGIPENMHNSVLLPYVQEKNNIGSGTGLGLAISTQLVTLMGGELIIETAPEGGTQVQVTLPLNHNNHEVNSSSDSNSEMHITSEALNILLVDDIPANLQVLSMQLASSQHWFMAASSAEQALALLDEHYFDVILTDFYMPEMNCYELAKVIRNRSEKINIPPQVILGCTANAFIYEKSMCMDSGMNGVLIKPVSQNQLLNEISRHYNLNNQQNSPCFEEINKIATGDAQQVIELLLTILQELEEDIRMLRKSIKDELIIDIECHRIHRMKGVFSLIRYDPALRICWRIEKGNWNGEPSVLETLLHYSDIFYNAVKLRILYHRET
ncbi:transporter substrate-binding domain-containing protein [Enterobacter ludwigii]|uniref:transporter substrate-binding domain-containing protein n=1 Tax=Enterobacter ludwigii TaxID=299767 RepID=UPI0006430E84|nr:transporter substrate-binding domain-containing protein [Enterobacter ludwigii]KLP40188.1 hypothetical protein ABR36_09950 [Enterobacter ludwigii]